MRALSGNIAKRGMTILVVAPTITALLQTPETMAFLVWFLVLMGMLEWTGLKRHLKVCLLHTRGAAIPEYTIPAAKTNTFIFLKCLGSSLAVLAAYISPTFFALSQAIYFFFWVVLTLMGQNKAEINACDAQRSLARERRERELAKNSGGEQNECDAAALFRQFELEVIATSYTTELFLNFALEYFGFLWVLGIAHSVLLARTGPQGCSLVTVIIVSNWVNDICALITGRALGGHTHALYPRISPKKSVEGAVVGVLANALCAPLCLYCVNRPEYDWGNAVLSPYISFAMLGLLFGILGVIGDLLQSVFKRAARVKDTGTFFPGHGGVLDRMDGLLLCYPLAYWLWQLLASWAGHPEGSISF